MLKEMVPEIISKLEKQRYKEAFINLEGLILFMHEHVKEYSGDEIFSITSAHDALTVILFELHAVNPLYVFNGKVEYCAHLAVLRLREALGHHASGRAANALTLCLEALMKKQQKENDEDGE